MRKILQKLLLRPVLWATAKFSSRPDRQRIFASLTKLYRCIVDRKTEKGFIIPFEIDSARFIIFSDQHKGARNGADDFTASEKNYLAALDHYHRNDFHFINLGDSEELWENRLSQVKKHNVANFEAEKKFVAAGRHTKIFGNHDLYWGNDPLAWWHLKQIYGQEVKAREGVVLETSIEDQRVHILCAHGHQGDAQSDGNWFSKFFIARIWAPLQGYLRINPNTPAYDGEKKSLHNSIMYEWCSEQKNLILVTGHTHQPVFTSLTLLERLYKRLQIAMAEGKEDLVNELKSEIRKREKENSAVAIDYMIMKPSYFNTGCCCFSDGDITGIEIADGEIRLIKWRWKDERSQRELLEAIPIRDVV